MMTENRDGTVTVTQKKRFLSCNVSKTLLQINLIPLKSSKVKVMTLTFLVFFTFWVVLIKKHVNFWKHEQFYKKSSQFEKRKMSKPSNWYFVFKKSIMLFCACSIHKIRKFLNFIWVIRRNTYRLTGSIFKTLIKSVL